MSKLILLLDEDCRHKNVEKWLPAFERDNRSYLTVAIGCTGGQHRSVYLVERLAQVFAAEWVTLKRHREHPGASPGSV